MHRASLVALSVSVITTFAVASCVNRSRSSVAFAAHPSVADTDVEAAGGAPLPALTNDGNVILVTLDGVRAADVFDGASPTLKPGVDVHASIRPDWVMPRTYALVAAHGVALGADRPGCGTVHTGDGANVSLPGYFEIFSGHPTACRDNQCAAITSPTVLDQAAAAGLSVASIGSWNVLDRAVTNGSGGFLVATGRQRFPGLRPLEDARLEGLVVAAERTEPYPGVGPYRPDALTMPIALRYFEDAQPAVMHVGLGDADEWGHRNDYASYLEALAAEDAFIGKLADAIDALGDVGKRTTVIVTTDHGRNEDFKDHGPASASAARSFVLAFGARVPPQGVACGSRDVTLVDIAPTIRALIGLPPDETDGAGQPSRRSPRRGSVLHLPHHCRPPGSHETNDESTTRART